VVRKLAIFSFSAYNLISISSMSFATFLTTLYKVVKSVLESRQLTPNISNPYHTQRSTSAFAAAGETEARENSREFKADIFKFGLVTLCNRVTLT